MNKDAIKVVKGNKKDAAEKTQAVIPTILRPASQASETVEIKESDEFYASHPDRQILIPANACQIIG
jgi:hypothetical protein